MSVYHNEGSRLRCLAMNPQVRIKFRNHALEEMAKDGLSQLAVFSMLRRCSVVRREQNRFEEVWTASGSDVDGNKIDAVVVAYEDVIMIKVITAWEPRR